MKQFEGGVNEMSGVTTGMQALIQRIRGFTFLDGYARVASGVVRKVTSPRPVKNALSGTWFGHPLHPTLTDVPIGAWTAATFLDLTAGRKGAGSARRLVGLGVLAVLPTAVSGLNDWSTTQGADRRVGLVHAWTNVAATGLQVASWTARRHGRRGTGIGLSALALGLTAGAGYLGGYLSFGRGVGVNHTAFQAGTDAWTDVAAEADLSRLTRITVDGVPVVMIKQDGQLYALSATCTHAGGPLDQGTLDEDGGLTCPWHGSRFDCRDGAVRRGPATAPEPSWDVKRDNGRVLIRASGA